MCRRGKVHGEDRTRPVGAVRCRDGAAHRRDEAAADGEAEARAGALPVGGIQPMELLENPGEPILRNPRSFIDDLQANGTFGLFRAENDG
jgi:hypothetical protein